MGERSGLKTRTATTESVSLCTWMKKLMAFLNWNQQGIAYAQTIAQATNLKLDADNPADREKLRRAILDLVAGRKMPKQKGRG
jgi:hypothetical protein